MMFKYDISTFLLFITTLITSSSTYEDNCSEIFKFDYDQQGKANIGLIDVVVPKKLVDTGFELEVLFELDSFPFEKTDLPKLEAIDNEPKVLDSIRSGEGVKYGVIYNLKKKFPRIVRISINDWSGFSPNIRISQIMCDNALNFNYPPVLMLSHIFRPSRAKLTAVRCVMDYNFYFGYCGFRLHLNETHPFIIPVSDIPAENVTKVYLGGESDQSGSKVHTLTHDICAAFRNVSVYEAFGLGLVKIHKNAFSDCLNLETIDLSHNNLTVLDEDLFEHNHKLRGMFLGVNQIIKINPEMFRNAPLLEEIIFSYNKLTEFPIARMRMLPKLKKIYLHENLLLDLDEHQIVEKFPQLEEILWMCPNRINHDRMDAIHEFFNGLNITTEEKYCQTRK